MHLYTYDFFGMAIIIAVMGFLRTWLHVPLPLVSLLFDIYIIGNHFDLYDIYFFRWLRNICHKKGIVIAHDLMSLVTQRQNAYNILTKNLFPNFDEN